MIHTAARDGCGLDLFHTHLSYHRDTQLHNIAAVMRAVQQTARAGALQVVLGGASESSLYIRSQLGVPRAAGVGSRLPQN